MVIKNGNRKLKLCDNTLYIMKKYIQFNKSDCEAGGILIGRENSGNENFIIEFITEPMGLDKRERYRYLRKDKGHIEFYQDLYKKNNGIYAYIGEWHTHPENIPNYSCIDAINWKKIGKTMNGGVQYHLIVGIQEVGIWEYTNHIKVIKKISSIKWKRIE